MSAELFTCDPGVTQGPEFSDPMARFTEYDRFLLDKQFRIQATGLCDVPPLNNKMFAYQKDVCSWALRMGRSAVFLGTGTGKSIIELEWARCVSQHTKSPVLVLAPLAVGKQTVNVEVPKFGISGVQYHEDGDSIQSPIVVTNYERLDRFDPNDFSGVVLDECFAKGTEIDTPSGKKRIENIRKGDYILNCAGIDKVSDTHRREVSYAALVKVGDSSFISSPNHPVFTQRGWVGAQHLRAGDYALATGAALSLVREGVLSEISESIRSEVLRDILLSEMEDESTGVSIQGAQQRGGSQKGSEEGCVVCVGVRCGKEGVGAHTRHESHEIPRDAPEDFHRIESHEAQTFRAWRQWSWPHSGANHDDGCSWKRMDSGISLVTGSTHTRLSIALQDRLRIAGEEARNRGGWGITQHGVEKTRRSQKRGETSFVRVDGVEILEPGDSRLEQFREADGKLYFYDLGATRHPSYSVGGFLVHNSSILKSMDGKTRSALIEAFAQTPYRLCATATPAPNDHMELGNHAELLSIMTAQEMLAMFFIHDGGDTQKWRLKGHARKEFWKWVCSWSVSMNRPSDIGYSDDGFILPPLHYHEHVVEMTTPTAGMLFAMPAESLQDRIAARRDSVEERVSEAADVVLAHPDESWICWCNLNDESSALTRVIDGLEVTGSDSQEYKEESILGFSSGKIPRLVSKSSIFGFGMNLQICSHIVFVGISDSWESFYQAVRRCWRFGQSRPVHVHIVVASTEGNVLDNLKRKEREAEEMAAEMAANTQDLTRINLRSERHTESSYHPSEEIIIPSWL